MKTVFEKIYKYIEHKDFAKFFFFTDGCGGYPTQEMKNIEDYFELNHDKFRHNKRNKLDILLMCELEKSNKLELIQQKFNDISRKHFGNLDNTKLLFNVETNLIGDLMISNFENFNLGIN